MVAHLKRLSDVIAGLELEVGRLVFDVWRTTGRGPFDDGPKGDDSLEAENAPEPEPEPEPPPPPKPTPPPPRPVRPAHEILADILGGLEPPKSPDDFSQQVTAVQDLEAVVSSRRLEGAKELPDDEKRLWLGAVVCWARALQDELLPDAYAQRVRQVFREASGFSRIEQPGWVNGFGLAHEILLLAFVSHKAAEPLIAACKANGVPLAFVERGYGTTQIMQAVERVAASRAAANE